MTMNLLESYKLNESITLKNRILMAPLTRCMADDNLVPTAASVEYYGRRASHKSGTQAVLLTLTFSQTEITV